MRNKDLAKQRLARAIEDSFPATLSEFINAILPPAAYAESVRWNAQKRALEYARSNYDYKPEQPS